MKFEDLMEAGHKRHSVSYDPYHGKPDDYYSSDDHYKKNNIQQLLLDKLKNNPVLKVVLIFVVIILLIAVIIALVLLFPQIIKLLSFINEKGLSGVIDYVLNSIK